MLRQMDKRSDKQTLLKSDTSDSEVEFAGGHKTEWSNKFTKTIVLSIAFFALGLCIAIPGPTLLDLGERVQTDTEHMSMIFTARSVGYLLGSIIGGFLFDHFDQQILMFYTLILSAIATVVTPWCTALIALAAVISFQGLSMGILSTGGNVFCIQIWKHRSAPYMQGLHFAFAIGAFIAPLLAWPFFSSDLQLNHANDSLISLPQGITPTVPNIPDFALLPHPSESHLVKRRDVTNLTATLNISTSTTVDNFSFPDLNVSNSSISTNGEQLSEEFSVGEDAKDFNDSNISTSTLTTTVTEIIHANPGSVDGSRLSEELIEGDNANDTPTSTLTIMTEIWSSKTGFVDEETASTEFAITVNAKYSNSSDISSSTIATVTELRKSNPGFVDGSRLSKEFADGENAKYSNSNYTPTSTVATATKTSHSNAEFVDGLDSNIDSLSTVNQSDLFNLSITTEIQSKTADGFGDFVHNTLNAVTHMSRIQFAYAIIGLLLIVNAFMFLVLYCKDRQRSQHKRWTNNDKRHNCVKNMSFNVVIFVLFLFFFAYVGMEVTFGGLLSTFVVEYLNWTKSQGATATAVFWGSLAAGRGICIFVAKCFKPPCMLVTNTILVVIGALILSFGIQVNDIFLWVGTVTIGFGMSSIFPTGISWADHYFPLTGKATAVFVVGSALGEMTIPVFTGYLYENKDKMALMYMMVAVGLFCAILYVIMQCIASHKQKRSTSSKKGFVRLDDEDNVSMDSLAPSYGSSSYAEQAHKRQGTSLKTVENRPEYDHLIDIND